MRTVNEIVIAVQEQQPATDQELRYALLAMNALEYSACREIESLIKGLESDKPAVQKFILQDAKGFQERRFNSQKLPLDVYLGPGNIPGTKENTERRKMAKAVLKAATGIEI